MKNQRPSARLLGDRALGFTSGSLTSLGVPKDKVERIVLLALATGHDMVPATDDLLLIVDLDLAILGAEPERFAEYECQY